MSYITITDPTQAVMFLGEEVEVFLNGEWKVGTLESVSKLALEIEIPSLDVTDFFQEIRVKAPEIRVGDVVEFTETFTGNFGDEDQRDIMRIECENEIDDLKGEHISNIKLISRGEGVPVR